MDGKQLCFEVAKERLQSQEALNAEYGGKAAGILGLSLAMVTAASIVLSISSVSLDAGEPSLWVFGMLAVAFLFTAWQCGRIFSPREWQRGPLLHDLAKYIADGTKYDGEVMVEWAGDTYTDSVEANKHLLNQRAGALQLAVTGLILAAFFLCLMALLLQTLT